MGQIQKMTLQPIDNTRGSPGVWLRLGGEDVGNGAEGDSIEPSTSLSHPLYAISNSQFYIHNSQLLVVYYIIFRVKKQVRSQK